MLELLRLEQAERQWRKGELYKSWVKEMQKKPFAPKLPKPPAISRTAAAMRLRTIRDQNVHHRNTHQGRFLLAKSVAENDARVNQEMEYDGLLGASLHKGLGATAIARIDNFKTLLNKV